MSNMDIELTEDQIDELQSDGLLVIANPDDPDRTITLWSEENDQWQRIQSGDPV